MSVASDRLALYLAAERKILRAQEVRGGDRTHRMAELSDVRAQIAALQREVAAEDAATGGGGPLRFYRANLNRAGR